MLQLIIFIFVIFIDIEFAGEIVGSLICFFAAETPSDDEDTYQRKLHALANPPSQAHVKIECCECKRGVTACRYAYHLEKCIGNGRASSRLQKFF